MDSQHGHGLSAAKKQRTQMTKNELAQQPANQEDEAKGDLLIYYWNMTTENWCRQVRKGRRWDGKRKGTHCNYRHIQFIFSATHRHPATDEEAREESLAHEAAEQWWRWSRWWKLALLKNIYILLVPVLSWTRGRQEWKGKKIRTIKWGWRCPSTRNFKE